jgi:hypothetical protein
MLSYVLWAVCSWLSVARSIDCAVMGDAPAALFPGNDAALLLRHPQPCSRRKASHRVCAYSQAREVDGTGPPDKCCSRWTAASVGARGSFRPAVLGWLIDWMCLLCSRQAASRQAGLCHPGLRMCPQPRLCAVSVLQSYVGRFCLNAAYHCA